MLRTRDVVIFIGALLFVLCGIVFTLVFDERNNFADSIAIPYFEVSSTTYAAEKPETGFDRNSIIERLRTALQTTPREVEPQPSVEESPSQAADDPSVNPEIPLGVVECGGDDTHSTVQFWPASGVSVLQEGAFRNAILESVTPAVSASSTASSSETSDVATQQKVLISLLASPIQNASDSCVPGEAIGVTVNGALIRNSDAAFYKGYGSEYLIGYARDGFPVYGYYEGEVDSCGGYAHSSGYRYTVSPDRAYLIGCFKGTPSAFNL